MNLNTGYKYSSKWDSKPLGARHQIQMVHDKSLIEAMKEEDKPDKLIVWKATRIMSFFPMELVIVHIPMFDKCRELE